MNTYELWLIYLLNELSFDTGSLLPVYHSEMNSLDHYCITLLQRHTHTQPLSDTLQINCSVSLQCIDEDDDEGHAVCHGLISDIEEDVSSSLW